MPMCDWSSDVCSSDLAHHTSRKGEPADRERERKRLPTVLFEHTTPSTCVKQQHPGAGSPVGTHHGRPAWGRRLSGPTPWYHTAPGASLTKTLIHWPARLQRPEVGPASGRARSRCSNNWDSLFLSLSLCLQALLACLSASPLDRLSPGKTQMATGTTKITADGDCSHEIKRCLLFERKAMTNLDSVLRVLLC